MFHDDGITRGHADSSAVQAAARRNGATFSPFNLTAQFRCTGSASYLAWQPARAPVLRNLEATIGSATASDKR